MEDKMEVREKIGQGDREEQNLEENVLKINSEESSNAEKEEKRNTLQTTTIKDNREDKKGLKGPIQKKGSEQKLRQ